MNLRDVFSESITSRLFLLDSSFDLSKIFAIANEKQFTTYVFEGLKFESQIEFSKHFGEVMNPPRVFWGWTSIEEQLALMDWVKRAKGEIIIYKNMEKFYNADRRQFDCLLDVFQTVAGLRNKNKRLPFVVFLQSSKPISLGFPYTSIKSK